MLTESPTTVIAYIHITPDVEVKLLPVPSNADPLSQLFQKKSRDNFIWNEFQYAC